MVSRRLWGLHTRHLHGVACSGWFLPIELRLQSSLRYHLNACTVLGSTMESFCPIKMYPSISTSRLKTRDMTKIFCADSSCRTNHGVCPALSFEPSDLAFLTSTLPPPDKRK